MRIIETKCTMTLMICFKDYNEGQQFICLMSNLDEDIINIITTHVASPAGDHHSVYRASASIKRWHDTMCSSSQGILLTSSLQYLQQHEDLAVKFVNCREEHQLFRTLFGNLGGHFEYANEPNLHIFMKNSSCNRYENLRPIQ